jgi:pimeloyl-ACP methyl ester carboxylesterase
MRAVLALAIGTAALALAAVPRQAAAEDRTAIAPDGVTISYRVEGAGEPTLVLVHGWACDRTHWDGAIAALGPGRRILAIDLAGHGRSTANRKAWTIAAFGADIAAVLDKEGVRRAILVGHSMGGSAIVEAARLRPAVVLALIGVDTYKDLTRPVYGQDDVDAYLRLYEPDYAAFAESAIRSMFRPETDAALADRIVKGMLRTPISASLGALAADMLYSPVAALAALGKPVAAINCDRFPTALDANRSVVPSFVLKTMRGVDHFLMLEAPGEFARVLEETIRELTGHATETPRMSASFQPGSKRSSKVA